MIVDVRLPPRAEQMRAFEVGLIPYVSADRAEVDEAGADEEAKEALAVRDIQRVEPAVSSGVPILFDPQPGVPSLEPKPSARPKSSAASGQRLRKRDGSAQVGWRST